MGRGASYLYAILMAGTAYADKLIHIWLSGLFFVLHPYFQQDPPILAPLYRVWVMHPVNQFFFPGCFPFDSKLLSRRNLGKVSL